MIITREQSAEDILAGLNAPNTTRNKRTLVAWMSAEGTNAKFNPLATTQPANGATDFNTTGVKNYPDRWTGVKATVETLRQHGHGYYPIRHGLRTNEASETVLEAVEESDWGTGGLALEVLRDGHVLRNFGDKPIGQ